MSPSERSRARIPTSMLSVRDVPPPRTPWSDVEPFAHLFNGYGRWNGVEALSDQARRVRALIAATELHLATVEELRSFLFFEQRSSRHADGEPDAGALGAVLEALARRLPGRPLVDPGQASFEGLPTDFLGAMVDGLRDHASMIVTAATRVAPEAAVVGAMAVGLRRHYYGGGHVLVEQEGRTDLIVAIDGATYAIEVKTAWERGFGENVGGIRKDRQKLARRGGPGAVLAFCFAVREPSEGSRVAREPLAETVRRFEAIPGGVGPAVLRSDEFTLEEGDELIDAQVLVWPSNAAG